MDDKSKNIIRVVVDAVVAILGLILGINLVG